MPKKKMTQKAAADYLAATIADYIDNGFPLACLVGEEKGNRPSIMHTLELMEALKTLGYEKSAAKISHWTEA